jgi:type I restriction enzyme S subunit
MTTFKPLRDLVSFRSGGTPSKQVPEYWDGDIPWASVKDFTSTSLSETQDFITQEGLRNSSANLIPKGHVIIPTRMSLGKAAINSVDLAINQDLRALIPKVPLDANFLLHAVLSLKEEIVKKGSGATVKGITQEQLYNLEIHVPEEFGDQIRIAHLLGKVEGLIAQRKQHLQQLDDLLKSVFLEMFGDPVRNEKGWTPAPLEQLGSINRGVSKHRPRNEPKLLGGRHPLIQTGEVSNAGTYITTYTQTYSDLGFVQSKRWPAGTLCITIAANIAKTGILTFDACFPDSVVGFVAHEGESNTLYVLGLFWFFQTILEKNAPAAAQRNINLEILRGLSVPKPPIELQDEFATIVEKVECLKSRCRESLTDMEALYSALSQQAFKGELDLSRVPLPTSQVHQIYPDGKLDIQIDSADRPLSLPELPATISSLSASGRRDALHYWLEAYLVTLSPGDKFDAAKLLDAINFRLAVMDDADRDFAIDDYDLLKKWTFDALRDSRLQQIRDITGHDEKGDPIFGNRIELRAAQA